jgi:hypothetical protein
MLEEGKFYTREEISGILGGNQQSFLPTKGDRVLCACLKPEWNPQAPDVMLVRQEDSYIELANKLCNQDGAVPVFVKEAPSKWEYVGDYEVERCSDDRADIDKHQELSGRTNLGMVVFLKKSS